MKKIFRFTLLLLSVIISSCGTYAYKSVSAKTPLFAKKNDFVGQLSLGGAGGEIHAAYAPLNYVGAMFSYAGSNRNTDSSLSSYGRKFKDFEVAIVPFYPYEDMRFEMPIGIGFTKSTGLQGAINSISPYTRSFIQPTIGYHWEKIELAAFMRITNIDYVYSKWGVDRRYEPGIMVRGGSEMVKVMFQMRYDYGTNYSYTPAANLGLYDRVEYLPFHLSFGVNFTLNFDPKKQAENHQ